MGGYTTGVDWGADGRSDRVRELVLDGFPSRKIAEIMTGELGMPVTANMIEHVRKRFGMFNLIERDDQVPIFDQEFDLPMDNWLVFADVHAPFHSEIWFNRMLLVAERLGIRKALCAGDLVDMEFAKHWHGEKPTNMEDEFSHVEQVITALEARFDEIYLIRGNHENRINRMTDSKVQARTVMRIFNSWNEKFRYSPYDKAWIGSEWMAVHPQSYSQISASVAVRLTEKFHRNVLNAHGHFIAKRFDRSGKYVGIDLGGLFSGSKVEYKQLKTTTHPEWNNGFGILYNGHFHQFDKLTDWKFWGVK